jgi:hypothetical protein
MYKNELLEDPVISTRRFKVRDLEKKPLSLW